MSISIILSEFAGGCQLKNVQNDLNNAIDTIEDNKLKTVFTKSYNPATGEPEEPEYLKGEVMTIIDENTLQNDEGLKFHKK